MKPNSPALVLKTRVFTGVVVLSNLMGNYLLRLGMRRVGKLLALSPWPYLEALLNPWVMAGVSLLILWLLSHMAMLSWADLSYVLPITAIGYVLVPVVGRFLLQEQVSLIRWTGILLIMAGACLVSFTPPQSKGAKP